LSVPLSPAPSTVYREGVHAVQVRTAVALLDAVGVARAHWCGNSQGGQSAMVAVITYPERVGKFVLGGPHIGTGGDSLSLGQSPVGRCPTNSSVESEQPQTRP
jgi:2-hydroxy-6-oxonona-2,4-dienedioate hydrolase